MNNQWTEGYKVLSEGLGNKDEVNIHDEQNSSEDLFHKPYNKWYLFNSEQGYKVPDLSLALNCTSKKA